MIQYKTETDFHDVQVDTIFGEAVEMDLLGRCIWINICDNYTAMPDLTFDGDDRYSHRC